MNSIRAKLISTHTIFHCYKVYYYFLVFVNGVLSEVLGHNIAEID